MADSAQEMHAQFDEIARTTAPQAAHAIVRALQSQGRRALKSMERFASDVLPKVRKAIPDFERFGMPKVAA